MLLGQQRVVFERLVEQRLSDTMIETETNQSGAQRVNSIRTPHIEEVAMRSAFRRCVRIAAGVTVCSTVATPVVVAMPVVVASAGGLLAFAFIALRRRSVAI